MYCILNTFEIKYFPRIVNTLQAEYLCRLYARQTRFSRVSARYWRWRFSPFLVARSLPDITVGVKRTSKAPRRREKPRVRRQRSAVIESAADPRSDCAGQHRPSSAGSARAGSADHGGRPTGNAADETVLPSAGSDRRHTQE